MIGSRLWHSYYTKIPHLTLPIVNTKQFLPKPAKITGLKKYVIMEYFYIY